MNGLYSFNPQVILYDIGARLQMTYPLKRFRVMNAYPKNESLTLVPNAYGEVPDGSATFDLYKKEYLNVDEARREYLDALAILPCMKIFEVTLMINDR